MELEAPQNCLICQDEIARPVVLECKHSFCLNCLPKWVSTSKTCPTCRSPINPEKIPVTGLNLSDIVEDNSRDEKLQRPVYYMSDRNIVELTTMANYGHSALSEFIRTRVAYECWTCNRFTDYMGHSFGCLGCLNTIRTKPRSMLMADMVDGQISTEHSYMDDATTRPYDQMAAHAQRFLFESTIVTGDRTRVMHYYTPRWQ